MNTRESTIKKRRLQGVVVSDKMNKTVVVSVTNYRWQAKYRKQYAVQNKFKAHDENNEYKTGDQVEIQETRPLSRDKCWEVVKLIERKKSEEKE
jgi:small subunit ribosomal protein S17